MAVLPCHCALRNKEYAAGEQDHSPSPDASKTTAPEFALSLDCRPWKQGRESATDKEHCSSAKDLDSVEESNPKSGPQRLVAVLRQRADALVAQQIGNDEAAVRAHRQPRQRPNL